MNEIVTMEQWNQWNDEIKERLKRTASDFVAIGFRLRQIRDSGIYDGAADLYEFAQREYGLGQSAVSRFIAINEKYSEGGYGLRLKEEYSNYKYSQLSEMLTLPDSQHQYVGENTTVKDIREMKSFNAEEKSLEQGQQLDMFTPPKNDTIPELDVLIHGLFEGKKEEWEDVRKEIKENPERGGSVVAEIVCPSGNRMYRKGLVLMMIQDYAHGITLRKMGQPDEKVTWDRFASEFWNMFDKCEEHYEHYYQSKAPEIAINTKAEPKEEPKENPKEEQKKPDILEKNMNIPVATPQEEKPLVENVEVTHNEEGITAKGTLTEEGKELVEKIQGEEFTETIDPEDVTVIDTQTEKEIPEWLKVLGVNLWKDFERAMKLLLEQNYKEASDILGDIYSSVMKYAEDSKEKDDSWLCESCAKKEEKTSFINGQKYCICTEPRSEFKSLEVMPEYTCSYWKRKVENKED